MNVLIIGGGVIGLGIAREMRIRGMRRITVLEQDRVGRAASWAAAGMLAPNAETEEIDDFYRSCVRSNEMYPRFAADLLGETGIDIELDDHGTLFLAFSQEDQAEIERRYRKQRDAGIDVERLTRAQVRSIEPNVAGAVCEGLYFRGDGQVENRKLLAALARYAEHNGISIRENTTVENLIIDNGRVTGAWCGAERIHADRTILATGAWSSLIKFGDESAPFDIKPIRGQIVCFTPKYRLIDRVIYDPKGYVVPRADGRVLAGSTVENAGFDAAVTVEGVERLKRMAAEILPALAEAEISDQWAGLRPFSPDGLPVIGEVAGLAGLTVATGHYRNGILLAPLTARVVADSITSGEPVNVPSCFTPARFAPSVNFAGC
jgi:glycine oxidase